MKIIAIVSFIGAIATSSLSCQTKSDDVSAADPRDARVGFYACDVKISNFVTKEVLSTYSDTVDVSKQGEAGLLVISRKNAPLPVLKSMDNIGRQYVGTFTGLVFNQGQTAITDGGELVMFSGPDAKFYEYKGNKLK